MGTRIVHFGIAPTGGILAALRGNGYEVDACGTSIAKLKQALQVPPPDAIAVAENSALKAAEILATVRFFGNVPTILLQDESRTWDPSPFDLVISENSPLPDLVRKVTALIERSRAIRANSEILGERFHSLLRESASLRQEALAAGVESQRIGSRLRRPVIGRVNLSSVLLVDDYARWRDTICSMLNDYADCRLLCAAEDGIEAVQRATELKPRLILLDLDLPRLNGIEAAKEISKVSPDSVILFLSMNHSADVVNMALSTGAKGYVLKADAGTELWPAIEAVIQGKQYLSRGLRGLHSVTIN